MEHTLIVEQHVKDMESFDDALARTARARGITVVEIIERFEEEPNDVAADPSWIVKVIADDPFAGIA